VAHSLQDRRAICRTQATHPARLRPAAASLERQPAVPVGGHGSERKAARALPRTATTETARPGRMNKDEQKDKDDQKSKSEQLEIRTTRFKRCSPGKSVSDRFVFHQSHLILEGGAILSVIALRSTFTLRESTTGELLLASPVVFAGIRTIRRCRVHRYCCRRRRLKRDHCEAALPYGQREHCAWCSPPPTCQLRDYKSHSWRAERWCLR